MRLSRRQEKEMMYEEMRDATPREAIALKATVEPMLMRERRTVMMKETRTALRGMFQPGLTCSTCEFESWKE